ncbi:unnamed protein product [Miscanthus lutarioriparius]|uniref:Uncharacterized protein n=1 Tax=Miscanthus lutarioriparius TaxID=422564 RepID=A0A811MTL6_9POAL|nr:unnamed protein product [Miscanthus lutarioriparius]
MQEQQILANQEEDNVMVGMAIMPPLQQGVWEEARAKEAAKLWDNYFGKASPTATEVFNNQAGSSMEIQNGGKNKGVIIQELEETETPYKKRNVTRRLTPVVESQFCKMDAEDITDEALLNKKKKTEPVARMVAQKQQNSEDAIGLTGRQVDQADNEDNEN